MPFIETSDGTRLHYQDRGEGEPIVFIHGWTLGADVWERQTTGLAAQGLRCVAYDRRGSGDSGRPVDGYDYDTLADDLAALMERLDLRGATLVGHSMGGGEVARYVARHGTGRVARAVFVAATTPFLLRTEDNPDGVDRAVFDGDDRRAAGGPGGLPGCQRADVLRRRAAGHLGARGDEGADGAAGVQLLARGGGRHRALVLRDRLPGRPAGVRRRADPRGPRRRGRERAARPVRAPDGGVDPGQPAGGLRGRAARPADHPRRPPQPDLLAFVRA
jgi:pimeloyl-ACP methyl ester carboxylesterase